MRFTFDLPYCGVTIPPNTTEALFIAAGGHRPTAGAQRARGYGEVRLLIGSGEAQPALQFANTIDGTPVHTAVGDNMDANGTVFPTTGGGMDITTNAGKYQLMRPGWLVRNIHATNTATMWMGGAIDVWGAS